MRKSLLLAGLFLACVAWVQAQTAPQPSSDSGSSTTVQGCLSGSEGNYTLTADSGTTYTLTGDTAKLKDHVGHEVSITGKASASSASSAASATSSTGGGQSLEVTSMKHVATSCKSAAK
jgi:hypothetical protein